MSKVSEKDPLNKKKAAISAKAAFFLCQRDQGF